MYNEGHWKDPGFQLEPELALGFVYIIVEKETNRKYIGKKNFAGRGKKNKGVASNWKTYTSSSKYLNELIEEKGITAFDFIILEQYYTLGGLSFAETYSQVICEIPSNNSEFLNRFIDKTTFKVTEPVTDRHKKRLKYYLRKYKFETQN